MEKKKSSFSGQIGFVLAAAGSAVGVGNLWRFPYLAAKDGGGLFLLVYLALVLTFGFALLSSDIAIGRRTKESAIGAYTQMAPKWKFLGILTFFVPVLIMTYYAVIGGWVTKYAVVYLTGQAEAAAADGYFNSFITSPVSPVVLVIAGYSLTLRHIGADGETRTGMQGLLYYLTPHTKGLTVSRFLQILLDAMSQLFFSLSVSMGIMITYGSYVKNDVDLNKAVNQIEIFDTGVALLAGAMIIPAVYVFSGTEGMTAGPSLMFISLPKVFAAMGKAGTVVGLLFFITTIFATLTSCISVLESIAANCMEIFRTDRKRTVLVLTVIYLAASAVIALGFSVFYFEVKLPNGSVGQLLDVLDYISNSVMMPLIALLSTLRRPGHDAGAVYAVHWNFGIGQKISAKHACRVPHRHTDRLEQSTPSRKPLRGRAFLLGRGEGFYDISAAQDMKQEETKEKCRIKIVHNIYH